MASSQMEPDKDERTRYMREYDARRQKRADRLFHWSLDMPPEDDDTNINQQSFGMGWKELAAVGLLMAAGMGGTAYVMQQQQTAAPQPIQQQAAPTDAGYEVVFYDANGNQIQLDRWPGSEK